MPIQSRAIRVRILAVAVLFGLVLLAAILPMTTSGRSFSSAGHSASQSASDTTSDYEQLEAVLDTTLGQIVLEFFPQDAPRHVEHFIKEARAGTYNKTAFHRVISNGLIQGGDPTTKNPKLRAQYGRGGLKAGIPDEINKHKHITGAVSASLALDPANPNQVLPGTSGSQFFIVVGPQPALDSKYTVFGRVVEGIDVVAKISNIPAQKPSGLATQRVEITRVTIREKTPTVEQMRAMQVTIETSLGQIQLQRCQKPRPMPRAPLCVTPGPAFTMIPASSGSRAVTILRVVTWPIGHRKAPTGNASSASGQSLLKRMKSSKCEGRFL